MQARDPPAPMMFQPSPKYVSNTGTIYYLFHVHKVNSRIIILARQNYRTNSAATMMPFPIKKYLQSL